MNGIYGLANTQQPGQHCSAVRPTKTLAACTMMRLEIMVGKPPIKISMALERQDFKIYFDPSLLVPCRTSKHLRFMTNTAPCFGVFSGARRAAQVADTAATTAAPRCNVGATNGWKGAAKSPPEDGYPGYIPQLHCMQLHAKLPGLAPGPPKAQRQMPERGVSPAACRLIKSY